MSSASRILVIEDSEDDFELLIRTLGTGGIAAEAMRVDSAATLAAALARQPWDAVLCDYALPGFSMGEAFAQLRASGLDVPFIVVSGTVGEERVAELMRRGASDVVLKRNIASRLVPTLQRELAAAAIRQRANATNAALRAREEQLADIAANVPGLVYRRVMRPDGALEYSSFSGGLLDGIGMTSADHQPLIAMTHPADHVQLLASIRQSSENLSPLEEDYRLVVPTGETRWVHTSSRPRRAADGSTIWDVVVIDVTERQRAEERLRLLQALSLTIAEAEDFDSALRLVIGKVCEAAGWPCGEAWVPDDRGEELILGPVWHIATEDWTWWEEQARRITHRRGVLAIGMAWESGKPLWIPDVTALAGVHPLRLPLLQRVPVKSAYVVPICADNRVLAVLNFPMLDIRREDHSLVEIVAAVAAQLGMAFRQKLLQEELRRNLALLESAQEIAGLGTWIADPVLDGGRLEWSPEVCRIFGIEPGAFDHRAETFFAAIHPGDRAAVIAARRQAVESGGSYRFEHRIVRRDGAVRWIHSRAKIGRDADGRALRMFGLVQDITEARLAAEQLAQAQKMEAIGNLTAGIAHDFNNMLGIIIGNVDLLQRSLRDRPADAELTGDVLAAALRGAELTRHLLSFARRQALQPSAFDVNERIGELFKLLRRTLGEHIETSLALDESAWPAMADPVQLDAALTNLAANARDAMPKGGRLTVATTNRTLDAAFCASHPGSVPGDYVLITVADSGAGIPPEILGRIFEPFFTTKELGKGTGLGLSMVLGFVEQTGGYVTAESAPDRGTEFRLYIPRAVIAARDAKPDADAVAATAPGGGTVLVVEDNDLLRRALTRQLDELGYRVMEAASAHSALRALQETGPAIDLLLTDMMMPGGVDGIELARRAILLRPSLKILLTSGVPDMILNDETDMPPHARFLAKPYRREELARALREAIGQTGSAQSPDTEGKPHT